MHHASLTLTLRVVELTLRLSLKKHRPESRGVTIREPRPLAKTHGVAPLLLTGAK